MIPCTPLRFARLNPPAVPDPHFPRRCRRAARVWTLAHIGAIVRSHDPPDQPLCGIHSASRAETRLRAAWGRLESGRWCVLGRSCGRTTRPTIGRSRAGLRQCPSDGAAICVRLRRWDLLKAYGGRKPAGTQARKGTVPHRVSKKAHQNGSPTSKGKPFFA